MVSNDKMLKGLQVSTLILKLQKQKESLITFSNDSNLAEPLKIQIKKILDIYDQVEELIKLSSLNNSDFKEIDLKYIYFILDKTIGNILNKSLSTYEYENFIYDILNNIDKLNLYLQGYLSDSKISLQVKNADALISRIEVNNNKLISLINQNNLLSEDLRNKTIHQVYDEDSSKFRKIARLYEISFYILLLLLAFYLFGYHIEVITPYLSFKFAEHFDDSNKTAFYIQKLSLIILSSTLAAFFLKRSFMNQRLADEAYKTAKEIDGLPRYLVGLPDEMKEKIRFDLAYKYFGNSIHHDSYTGGENLMHENIKANTDFIKAVKDIPDSKKDKED